MADDMDDVEDMLEATFKAAHSQDGHAKKGASNDYHMKGSGDTPSESEEREVNKSEHSKVSTSESRQTNGDNTKSEENGAESAGAMGQDGDTEAKKKEEKDGSKEKDKDSSSKSKDKSSRDKEKDKEKEGKSSRHHKDKDKDKDRSRSRDRKRSSRSSRSRTRSGSRSKRSKRSKSRSKSRDRDRDRRRRSSRSRSPRDRDRRHRSRDRHRSRSSGRRSSREDSAARRRRRSSRSKSKSPALPPKREKSPELTPEERDQRTVFCMQLSARIRPRDLEEFFAAVGKVRDVRLITDPRTKRSKGIAYIEFRDVESVPLAIALTGQRLLGVPIIVKLTQAEKNRLPFTGPHIPANLPQTGPIKLYVGSLHPNITEDMLQAIFEPFGPIDAIVLARDESQRSKGFGFIQFQNAEDGRKAIEQLNNFELAGKPIKVSLFITEKAFEIIPVPGGATAVPTPLAAAMMSAAGGGVTAPAPPGVPQPQPNLDNDELDRTGVNLGPSGKLALMAKLAEGTGLKVPQQALDAISLSNATNGASATQCFLLSNMFDLNEEKQRPNWDEEIRDDVIQECTKYGGVVHMYVDPDAPEGNIYIKCPSIAIAMAAMHGLNGRFFAGRQIAASYIPIATYHQRFPESVHCVQLLRPLTTILPATA